MGFQLPCIFALLTLTLVESHAAQSPQVYWHSVLANTPIPKSLSHILPSDLAEEKSISVAVGRGGVNVDSRKVRISYRNAATVDSKVIYKNAAKGGSQVIYKNAPTVDSKVIYKNAANVDSKVIYKNTPTVDSKVIYKNAANVDSKVIYKNTPTVDSKVIYKNAAKVDSKVIYKNAANVDSKVIYKNAAKVDSKVIYKNAGTEAQLHDDPHVTIFFLEKDMQPGTKMNLDFTSSNTATFLPRKIAESIPFSSSKLPQILEQFSLKPGSAEADAVKETIEMCENPAMRGEEKYCATSLESMIDFSTSKLGRDVQAVSTEVDQGTPVQKYTILSGVKKMTGDISVACHKLSYAYAVFYCHAIKATRAYTVSLRGADGVNTNAIAFCHTDTSEWDLKHLAFKVLKVKPGTIPICHFFSGDSVVWVPSQKST